MRLRTLITALLSVAALFPSLGQARAERKPAEDPPPVLTPDARHDRRRDFTPEDAAREVQRRHGGRVLAVQPDGLGYRVRVLKNGEVRIYQINP